MSKPLNTIVSAEAQKAWHAAKTLEEKVAAVNKSEELRHLFHEAWEIWNNLPDDPDPAASPVVVSPPAPEPSATTTE